MNLKKLAEKLSQGIWSVDCHEMKLVPRRDATEYVGPGYLLQETDGIITYKVYPPRPAKLDPRSIFPTTGTAGRIIDADRYYLLEAVDTVGNLWRADRTLPTPDTSFLSSGQFQLVTGTADELVVSRAKTLGGSSLTMTFFTEVHVPANASTKVTTVMPNGSAIHSSNRDTAQFQTAFGKFNIYNRPGMLVVEVVSATVFPPHFETRIIEALGFVLAKPLMWNVLVLITNGIETVRLRGKREAIEAKLQPPISRETIDMSGGDVWRLFDKYLLLVCAHAEPGFHPASRHVFSVLQASAGGISARGLALGVAAEGITKDLFPDVGAMPATLKPMVKRLRSYFRAWPEFESEETKKALYDRVDALLGRILDVSARSRLHALANENVIYGAHINAWNKLRHASAHGVTLGSADIQQLVDLCDNVTVLMYHLVFGAVGYEGRYRDYSVHGWPMKYYRGRPPTDREIAVAAYYIWQKAGAQHGHDLEHWFAGKVELEKGTY